MVGLSGFGATQGFSWAAELLASPAPSFFKGQSGAEKVSLLSFNSIKPDTG